MGILQIVLFGTVVLITHFIEGITGFGCTVLALPFAIGLVGVKTAVPVLVVVAWLLALYIVIVDFKNIVWKEFIKIVTFVILGLPIGMWLFNILPEAELKKMLGVFMILVSIRGLYAAFKKKPVEKCCEMQGAGTESKAAKSESAAAGETKVQSVFVKWLLNFVLFLGGIIHGAFGSGGPFVVIYASQALRDKSQFRATICLLWFTLNSIIIVKNIQGGVMTAPVMNLLLWTLPFLVVGMILGNWAHKKIHNDAFTKVVYGVLLLSGVFMVI